MATIKCHHCKAKFTYKGNAKNKNIDKLHIMNTYKIFQMDNKHYYCIDCASRISNRFLGKYTED